MNAIKPLFWTFILTLLTACGTMVSLSTPTLTPVPPQTSAPTTTMLPTETVIPTETVEPTATLDPTPNPEQRAFLEQLRMVYAKEGNLYLQDGTNPPKQLTNSGQDFGPLISDDGQKIVFYRNLPTESSQVYSISADGSQEQPVINRRILNALNLGYPDPDNVRAEYMVFVPGTHLLLFDTMMISSEQARSGSGEHTSYDDLLVADTDTAKINRLFGYKQVSRFKVSPDGKLVAIQTRDQVKIIDISGQVLRSALLTYNFDGWFFPISWHWMEDSSALFVLLPRKWDLTIVDYNATPFAVWRCSMQGGSPVEIELAPSPLSFEYSISPDGKWIVYLYSNPLVAPNLLTETDRSFPEGIYLGNLQDGSAKLISERPEYGATDFQWAPDSAHFSFRTGLSYHMVFGNLNGELTQKDIRDFIGWVDANHFLFGNINLGEINTKTVLKLGEGSIPSFVVLKSK